MVNITKDAIAGAVSGFLSGAKGLISSFKADPTKVAEFEAGLNMLQEKTEVELKEIEVKLREVEAKELETVNQTMREESKSEHWAQWLWRPMIGFTLCAILINNYVVLPYFKNKGMELITIPDSVFMSMLVILGAASAGRGLTKWQAAKGK